MSAESRTDRARGSGREFLPRPPRQLGTVALVDQQLELVVRLHVVLQSHRAHRLVLVPFGVAARLDAVDQSTAHVDGIPLRMDG